MAISKIQTIYFSVDVAPKAHDMGRNLLRGAALDSMTDIYDGNIALLRYVGCDDSHAQIVDGIDGAKALAVTVDDGETAQYRGPLFMARVVPGTTYTASVYVKSTTGQYLYLEAKKYGATADTLYSSTHSTPMTTSTNWERKTFTFTAEEGYDYVQINFFTLAPGTIYFCEPKLERGDTATAFCLNELDLKGASGKNNFLHVAWCNNIEPSTQKPSKDEPIYLSKDTQGASYDYMGTWVSETEETTEAEARELATWVYIKGAKGDDGSIYDIYLSASVLKGDSTGKLNDSDSVPVTAKLVRVTGGTATQVTSTDEAYFTISRTETGGDIVSYSRGNKSEFTVEKFDAWGSYVKTWNFSLYVGGVFLKTVTLPVIRDGANGNGTPATVFTIEPVGNINASGTLTDANEISVDIAGDVKAYKIIGDSKEEYSSQPQSWRLSIGKENHDGISTFNNNASNNIISFNFSNDYDLSNTPGSAVITLFSDSSLTDQLASLIVPISLNPSAIVDVNNKLGTIQSTTMSMQDDMNGMKGSIETIKQGQGAIELKVQGLGRDGVNMIYGGDVLGLAENRKYSAFQSNQVELKANVTYTVSARMWMNASSSHNMLLVVFDDTWNVLNASKNFSNTSAQVDGFSFTPKTDVKARVGIYEQDGKGGDPLSYVGIYIDWVRLEKGNLKDDDLKIDSLPTKWTPSLADIEANNLIPDPDFENSTWEMSDGGATRELNNYQKTGTDFMSQYSGDQGTYGIYGLRMTRSGYSGSNINDGMQYYIPFQGAGDYTLSVFFKNLGNAVLDSEAVVEIHPCGADKTRTRGGTIVAINKSNSTIGYVLRNVTRTFPEYETRSSDGKSVKTEWIEVRIFLTKNGDVVVSRLSLAKCSHAVHWNAATLRSTNTAYSVADNLLATGIDIKSHKIAATTDNFEVRSNSGTTTFTIDKDGNIVGAGNASFKGTVYASGGSFTGTVTASEFSLVSDNFTAKSDGTFKLNMTNFKVDESGNITAKGGSISFLKFDEAGMYGGVVSYSTPSYCTGISLTSTNISVGGSGGGFLSNVFLGNGRSDFRTTMAGVTVKRVDGYTASRFYNYIRLTNTGGSSVSTSNEDAALGVETDGNFCITALGGPSCFQGLCLPSASGSSSMTADGKRTMYLFSGGDFNMPSNPPDGLEIKVIQTGSKITFHANGHRFRNGQNYSDTFTSNTRGQWNFFYFDGFNWHWNYMNN